MSSYIAHSSSVWEEEMKPFIKAFKPGITLDSMREMTQLQAKMSVFFSLGS